jgi:hypothetical protein
MARPGLIFLEGFHHMIVKGGIRNEYFHPSVVAGA